MQTVPVPTINDDHPGHDYLCWLWRHLGGDGVHVRFDFTSCRFLRQNAVAFLGGLARLIELRSGTVEFAWDTLEARVKANLAQNGFMEAFGGPGQSWVGNSIPYLAHAVPADHEFAEYLRALWLGRGWVGVSSRLCDAIVGNVAETYVNAFEHARSPVGVFCCGQHYPKINLLKLTLVDFGVGIPSNVRLFKAQDATAQPWTGASCMQWAFQRGTSTKPVSAPGPHGIGLDLLQAFVRRNRGWLEMFSHEGHTLITEGKTTFGERPGYFEGTLVNISLRCDESYYCLASELDARPPF